MKFKQALEELPSVFTEDQLTVLTDTYAMLYGYNAAWAMRNKTIYGKVDSYREGYSVGVYICMLMINGKYAQVLTFKYINEVGELGELGEFDEDDEAFPSFGIDIAESGLNPLEKGIDKCGRLLKKEQRRAIYQVANAISAYCEEVEDEEDNEDFGYIDGLLQAIDDCVSKVTRGTFGDYCLMDRFGRGSF
jgi:hypothetical protein